MEYSDYNTSVDPTGTRNHLRIKYPDDDNPAYYYETDEGSYHITKFMGIWDESGPYEDSHFIEACEGGGATITDIEHHEIPAVAGNAVALPEHTTRRVACPACGTIATITLDELRAHNDSLHDGISVAKSVDEFTADDLPNMNTVQNPGDWADEFNGIITDNGELTNTDIHTADD